MRSLFGSSDYQGLCKIHARKSARLGQGTQTDNNPIEKFSTTIMFSMPTLMEDMKPVVVGKCEFDYREKLILKVSSDFLDYQDSVAREKNNDLPME